MTVWEDFVRTRITELRIGKNVSEHRMSLDLDKSGSYIRNITSGVALPSMKELFRIIDYFGLTPAEFFAPLSNDSTVYGATCRRLLSLNDSELNKVNTFLDMI